MKRFNIEATRNLPDHDRVLQAILGFFYETPGVEGCFLSGSMAKLVMDEDSDLDLGLVFEGAEAREAAWRQRWKWEITDWFHRLDADHIKPHFVIYLYEPCIKGDINLYTADDLPPVGGGPYSIVWDHHGVLDGWMKKSYRRDQREPDWGSAVHEDERFWAWSFYVFGHLHRGEYYHIAEEFPALRDIVEQWAARLEGRASFNSRHLEKQAFAKALLSYDLFPKARLESLKTCMLDLMELQLELRAEVGEKLGIQWKTTDEAIEKICKLIQSL